MLQKLDLGRNIAEQVGAGCLIAFATLGFASAVPAQTAVPQRCEQQTPTIFAITGPIDSALAECVEQRFQDTTTTLVLNSAGGSVASALDIAAKFEGRGLTMRVETQCNSSCANYWLPLARRVELEPGALIMLHGSLDPRLVEGFVASRTQVIADHQAQGMTEAAATASFEEAAARLRVNASREAAFVARNDIPRGWMLYRVPGSNRIHDVSGRVFGYGRIGVIVEERFFRSCFPGIEVEPFQRDLDRRYLKSLRAIELLARGVSRTASMECVRAAEAVDR